MKRHSAHEAAFGIFACIAMMLGCALDVFRNVQKGAWVYFWLSLISTIFFAAVVGWLLIDAFNRMQRRRRERSGPSES